MEGCGEGHSKADDLSNLFPNNVNIPSTWSFEEDVSLKIFLHESQSFLYIEEKSFIVGIGKSLN